MDKKWGDFGRRTSGPISWSVAVSSSIHYKKQTSRKDDRGVAEAQLTEACESRCIVLKYDYFASHTVQPKSPLGNVTQTYLDKLLRVVKPHWEGCQESTRTASEQPQCPQESRLYFREIRRFRDLEEADLDHSVPYYCYDNHSSQANAVVIGLPLDLSPSHSTTSTPSRPLIKESCSLIA